MAWNLLLASAIVVSTAAVASKVVAPEAGTTHTGACREARIAALRIAQPVVDPAATLATPADADPATVQFLVIADLAIEDSHASEDGQVLWIARAAMDGPHADHKIGAALFLEAINHRVRLATGLDCPMLPIQDDTAPASSGPAPVPVPVMIGEVADLDACTSQGRVVRLRETLLAVRAGPGTQYEQLDELANGRWVNLCDTSADGPWVGIVYAPDGTDCGVGSPVPTRRAYDGPCRSGWVHTAWIEVVAG